MIVLPVVRGTVATLTEGGLALDGGFSVVGAVFTAIGLALSARRADSHGADEGAGPSRQSPGLGSLPTSSL